MFNETNHVVSPVFFLSSYPTSKVARVATRRLGLEQHLALVIWSSGIYNLRSTENGSLE